MRIIAKLPSARPFSAYVAQASAMVGCLLIGTAFNLSARAQTSGAPVYAVTYVDVASNAVSQGIALLKTYRDAGQRENANVEFTILQEMNRPNRFAVVEGWKDQTAFDAHDKGSTRAQFEDALRPVRNSPPDRHMLQPFANAAARAVPPGALYMVEHVDFLGGDPAIAATAAPLVKTLAEASQKEAGTLRYDVYRQPPPRINHYQVVAVWPDAKAFDAHEVAAHTRQFRDATAQGGRAWRANLYDQRLYKTL
jgi:quinol monooxygenase YgiN